MVPIVVVLSIITVLAIMRSRNLAIDRGRHVSGWMMATALFPPIVLILWASPARRLASKA